MTATTERRRHPRVASEFQVRFGASTLARVRDLSRSGVRCLTPAPLAAMTVLGLTLELPSGDGFEEVRCRGVVVRTRPLPDAGEPRFEAAVLFTDLTEDQRDTLDRFVRRRLDPPAA